MESVGSSRTSHFRMGHLQSLDEFKFMRRKSSYGTTPGMVGEGGPRVSLRSFLANVNGIIPDVTSCKS